MILTFSSNGLVEGGMDCTVDLNKGQGYDTETVYDVAGWVRNQLLALDVLDKARNKATFHHIWIGDVVMPFALIGARNSKFSAHCVHPEIRNDFDSSCESTIPETVAEWVTRKAQHVSDLEWAPEFGPARS